MRRALPWLVLVALAASGLCAAAWGAARVAVPRASSFVSVWPGARGRSLAIEQFSLRSGAPLATLIREPSFGVQVSSPHPDGRGDLWFTTTIGPRCSSNVEGCGPVADSCTSTVHRLDPATGAEATVTSFPSSDLVSDAIPSPRHGLVAFVAGGCTTSFFDEHLVIEKLGTDRSWSIGADARPCHSLSTPAWSPDGTRLVFSYGPSALAAGEQWPVTAGLSCLATRAAGLVVVSATEGSTTGSWRFISPRRGCSYTSAAFDAAGIAAFEACSPGRRGPAPNDFEGPDFVVQLDRRGHVRFRLALELGANPGFVLSGPRTGDVLVTQDQTYRQGRPTHNWVWQLEGNRLRLIAAYPFNGYAVMAAQPW